MSGWKALADFMYGDVRIDKGFWYSRPAREIDELTEEQLFWVPDPKNLCILWHVGHIAHRERTHIGRFLQGLQEPIIPAQYEVFGPDWWSAEKIRDSIDSVQAVLGWVEKVRKKSNEYIASLSEKDFDTVPPRSEFGLSVGHWLFITVAHTALHIGRIQLLRDLVQGNYERPC